MQAASLGHPRSTLVEPVLPAPFLVFTSNVFAILGLRSLYLALAGMVKKFRYLKVALALVLMVVGIKMLLAEC